jgi:parallel beta-helix repeat protein
MPTLPVIFLGSSNEASQFTRRLAAELEATGEVEVLPWYEAFDAGFGALEDLAKRLREVDLAAFLLMPEDQSRVRGQTRGVPRDNVIFELGLFMGKLNRERTFALVENPSKGGAPVELPTDFEGVTQVRYPPGDEAWLASDLARRIRPLGQVRRVPAGTHVVEPNAEGRDVYGTIAAAVKAANAGDVILVRPGVYTEPLVINKPVEIIGVGGLDTDSDQAIIRTHESTAISYEASRGHGRIATLTIEGGGDGKCSLDVVEGRLAIRGCVMRGTGPLEACVRIRGDGRADLYASIIEDSEGVGVLVCEKGHAEIRANRVYGHRHSCIEVRDRTHPKIVSNRIGNGAGGGIWVHGSSNAKIEGNEIFGHELAGVTVAEGANPEIKSNRIHKCEFAGIHVKDEGRGRILDNDIHDNVGSGIGVVSGGDPVIEGNRIYDGLGGGIEMAKGARGHITGNHVHSNQRAGVAFLAECGPVKFRGNTVIDGLAEGIYDEIGVPENGNHVLGNKENWRRTGAVV